MQFAQGSDTRARVGYIDFIGTRRARAEHARRSK
jgi:hypothetical protein